MSIWTHITASIFIEARKDDPNIVESIKERLKQAPKITGSEHGATINVIPSYDYTSSTNMDCKRCIYGKTVQYHNDNTFSCDAPEDFKCPDGEFITRLCIVIFGDLRDRRYYETEKEWLAFLDWCRKQTDLFMTRFGLDDWDINYIKENYKDRWEEEIKDRKSEEMFSCKILEA